MSISHHVFEKTSCDMHAYMILFQCMLLDTAENGQYDVFHIVPTHM